MLEILPAMLMKLDRQQDCVSVTVGIFISTVGPYYTVLHRIFSKIVIPDSTFSYNPSWGNKKESQGWKKNSFLVPIGTKKVSCEARFFFIPGSAVYFFLYRLSTFWLILVILTPISWRLVRASGNWLFHCSWGSIHNMSKNLSNGPSKSVEKNIGPHQKKVENHWSSCFIDYVGHRCATGGDLILAPPTTPSPPLSYSIHRYF